MSKLNVLVLIACCLSCKIFLSSGLDVGFDFFRLVLYWPQTACWNVNNDWPNATKTCTRCRMPRPDDWALHGLWPTNFDRDLDTCNYEPQDNKIPKIEDRMSEDLKKRLGLHMPVFKYGKKILYFWLHQYLKHGTCATRFKDTSTTAKYFEKSLELHRIHNLTSILSAARIVPGYDYDFSKIYEVIKDEYNMTDFILQCYVDFQVNVQYLLQVHLCLDHSYRVIKCEETRSTITSCNSRRKIRYQKPFPRCGISKSGTSDPLSGSISKSGTSDSLYSISKSGTDESLNEL